MKIVVCLPTTGRAELVRCRVADLLAQDVPDGVELLVVAAVMEDDRESRAVVDWLMRMPDTGRQARL